MASIIQMHDGVVIKRFPINRPSIRIGRKPDNDVCFHPTEDRAASGHHAEIARQESGWLYTDKGSSNGSWCEGRRIDQLTLAGGEVIEIGQGGPQLKIELVGRVIPGSPADEAGLRLDDRIVRIDGEPSDRLGMDEVEKMLKTEGDEVTVDVRRGNESHRYRVRLRRLI